MKTKTKIIIAVAVAIVLLGAVIGVGLFTKNKTEDKPTTAASTTAPSESYSFMQESTTLFDWEEYREQLLSSETSNPSDVSGVSGVSDVSAVSQGATQVINPLTPTVYISYVYIDPGTQPQTAPPQTSPPATTGKSTTQPPQNEMIDFQYTYDSESKTVSLNKYTGSDTTVVIPATVNGNKIVKIGNDCFKGKNAEIVYVGKNIEVIGDRAFKDCTKLNQVFFMGRENVKLGANTFEGCTGLTYISLSTGTTAIGDSCFADCTSLKKMSVPETVTSIGANPWVGCDITLSVKDGSVAHQKALSWYIPVEVH